MKNTFESMASVAGIDERDKKNIKVARLYQEFPDIKNVSEVFKNVLRKQDAPGFSQEMTDVLQQLTGAVKILQASLKNQETYSMVDKRWMRDTNSIKEALERGRWCMELDIRLDKEGEFWGSHAVGAKYTLLPPYIHNMTTEQMKNQSRRYLLEDGLKEFSQYGDKGHRLILELKTLGDRPEKFGDTLKRLKEMIYKYDLISSVAVASLSPGILMATHQAMPNMPLILNGGIVPGISYIDNGKGITQKIIPADKTWRAFRVGNLMEVVISNGENVPFRADGHGNQTSYALAKLPNEFINILREQQERGTKFGGFVSLSAVTIMASILEAVGDKTKAIKMRNYYSEVVKKLGLGIMATTWGQSLNNIPRLKQLSASEQLRVFKEEFGLDTIVYTKSPEEWAANLPENIRDLLKNEDR